MMSPLIARTCCRSRRSLQSGSCRRRRVAPIRRRNAARHLRGTHRRGNASRNGSGRQPSDSVIVATPAPSRQRAKRLTTPLPTVNIELPHRCRSAGAARSKPPTRTMACTAVSPRLWRCSLSSRRSRLACCPWSAALVGRHAGSGFGRAAQRPGSGGGASRCLSLDVGRRRRQYYVDIVGHEGDRDRQAVLVERGTSSKLLCTPTSSRIEVVLPHRRPSAEHPRRRTRSRLPRRRRGNPRCRTTSSMVNAPAGSSSLVSEISMP